jgi:hypothetical protein
MPRRPANPYVRGVSLGYAQPATIPAAFRSDAALGEPADQRHDRGRPRDTATGGDAGAAAGGGSGPASRHRLAWERGDYGRGLLLADGSVHTWPAWEAKDGGWWPLHREYRQLTPGLPPTVAMFVIERDGRISDFQGRRTLDAISDVLAADCRLDGEHYLEILPDCPPGPPPPIPLDEPLRAASCQLRRHAHLLNVTPFTYAREGD